MSIAVVLAGQLLAALIPTSEDVAAYKPFRDCVLASAQNLQASAQDAAAIGGAARATCRTIRINIVRSFAAEELRNIAEAIKNGGSGGDPERQSRLAVLDRELDEDVALQLVQSRTQRKN